MELAPSTFWNMSLVEWRAALAGLHVRRGAAPDMTRAELARLMRAHPDKG